MKRHLTQIELVDAGRVLCDTLFSDYPNARSNGIRLYGVPRGGVSAAYIVQSESLLRGVPCDVVDNPKNADILVDDLVDSGKTRERYAEQFPSKPFYSLITKTEDGSSGYKLGEWLVFPWEGSEEKSAEDTVVRLLQFIGEDPKRGGLLETPARVLKAWKHWTSGYGADIKAILKTFEDGAERYDEMIAVRDIPFYSQCEHHLAPFFGTATFAYVPDKRIVGLSKMSRLVDAFARRLQVQERLTAQVVDAFMTELAPKGAACLIKARHMCMESRGVCQQGSETVTSVLRGVFKDGPVRNEFLSLARN
jgi:GTP cyclohydrolase I